MELKQAKLIKQLSYEVVIVVSTSNAQVRYIFDKLIGSSRSRVSLSASHIPHLLAQATKASCLDCLSSILAIMTSSMYSHPNHVQLLLPRSS